METTYNVNRQNTVLYPLGTSGEGTIVTFETRHHLGNTLVEILSERGIDVNNLVNLDGTPKKELINALSDMAIINSDVLQSIKGKSAYTAPGKKGKEKILIGND